MSTASGIPVDFKRASFTRSRKEKIIMKYCSHCGNELLDEAVICPKCGCPCDENWNKKNSKVINPNASDKSRGMALLLCALLGGLGIHRFYVKKTGTGVLWLLTFGLFGIGIIIDLIMIVCGNFTDDEGKVLEKWDFD